MDVHRFVVDLNTLATARLCVTMRFYWIDLQLLMVDVPETDVKRIRCRSSNAGGNRTVVFLWGILLSGN